MRSRHIGYTRTVGSETDAACGAGAGGAHVCAVAGAMWRNGCVLAKCDGPVPIIITGGRPDSVVL